MVYHGPSKGCLPCRQRKIRCDLTRPHCQTCVKRGVACSGPRIGKGETEFRNEVIPIGRSVHSQVLKQMAMRSANHQWPIKAPETPAEVESSTDSDEPASVPDDQAVLYDNYSTGTVCFCDECSGYSASDSSSPEISLIPRSPADGQYGNAYIGVCKADPALVSLLDFWRRMALYDLSPSTPQARPDLGKKAWALSLLSLHDECLGYAFLAVASCYYAKVSTSYDMNVFHLKARVRSVSSARKQLQTWGLAERVVSNLGIILAAELVAEDYNACSHHARFLANILQPKDGPPPDVGEGTRHSFLHMDVERATATGTQCFLDLSTWHYEKAALDAWSTTILADTTLHTPPQPDLDRAALTDPNLPALLTQIRYYDDLLRHPSTATTISRATAFQLSTAIDIIAGKLLNYYTSQISRLVHSDYAAALASPNYLATAQQAAASLAALYHLRLRTRQEYAGPTHDKDEPLMMERFCALAPRIHHRIERLLRVSDRAFRALVRQQQPTATTATIPTTATAAAVPPAVRLRLWILHVGSIMEATADFAPRATPPVYCREATQHLLRDAGLAGQEGVVREILCGFLTLQQQPPAFISQEAAKANGAGTGTGGNGMEVSGDLVVALPKNVYGPRWLSPVLRTWGLTNWDGEMG